MLYVVTGFPRSGTSIMMQALKAGGIEPMYSPVREYQQTTRRAAANQHWYELKPERMADPAFLEREVVDGMALKLPTPYLLNLPSRLDVLMIWMHRDPMQIRASYEKWYSDRLFQEQMPASDWPANYYETTNVMRGHMEDRKSVKQIIDIQLDELIADPLLHLSRIPGIDTIAACAPLAISREP